MSHKYDITSSSPDPEVDLVSLTFRSGHGTFSFGGEASLAPTLALSPSFLSTVALPFDTSERGSTPMDSRFRQDLKSYEDIGSNSTFGEGLTPLTHRSRHESRSFASTEGFNDWGVLNEENESGTGMVVEKARRDQVDESIVPTEGEPSNVLGYVSSRTIPSPQWSLALQDQTFCQNLGDQAKAGLQRNSTMISPSVLSAITSGGSQQPCAACPAVEKVLLASINKVLLKKVRRRRQTDLEDYQEADGQITTHTEHPIFI
ncbi:hypothetical protein BCR39DRAFT_562534 [Naematelia encephala]|uniref:Uncharacterized protein n=1 Tax=Naematelia encephala TaxID=71784 RepID=A0A1Y2AH54_9TREE|nr:hypothetical protein BCR39DRAFT_562534 [Naematelia encephala]